MVALVGVVVALVLAAAVLLVRSGDGPGSGGPRTETVLVEAPRGRILDRTGVVLVEDGTVLEVRADAAAVAALDPAERTDLVEALATALPPEAMVGIEDRLAGAEGSVVLATGVDDQVRAAVQAEPDRFPGVVVAPQAGRTYRYGTLAAHVLGYLGRISAEELEQRSDEDLAPDTLVGKAGVERSMDAQLRGEPGAVVYELDDAGRRVRELIDRREEPRPGRDVYLTIDIDLQYLVEKGLAAETERRRGVQDNGCFLPGGCDPSGAASVAVDPRDGQVLALASYPTYDPALFVGGISTEAYAALTAPERVDEHHNPLLDRATAGQYTPGSTLKPFTAHAGLATEVITPDEVHNDTGVHRYSADCPVDQPNNCSAQNAGATPHGPIDLADALRVSSDTYFYALGDRAWRGRAELGEEALQEQLVGWGFGEQTGIDLAGEAPGRVPTPSWLREFSDSINSDDPQLAAEAGTWTAGTSGNLAAGQGDTLATPLQLASAYATLANGGTIWRPQLVLQTTAFGSGDDVEVTEPEATGAVELPGGWRDRMVAGLDGVTKGDGGTATTVFAGFDQETCSVMAKTGTARVADRNDTSLFVAVAPTPVEGREPVIALATVVEEVGSGSAAAAPHARRVLEPFASAGCDLVAFGETGSPFTAPAGGAFDVEEAIAEYVPPSAGTGD